MANPLGVFVVARPFFVRGMANRGPCNLPPILGDRIASPEDSWASVFTASPGAFTTPKLASLKNAKKSRADLWCNQGMVVCYKGTGVRENEE